MAPLFGGVCPHACGRIAGLLLYAHKRIAAILRNVAIGSIGADLCKTETRARDRSTAPRQSRHGLPLDRRSVRRSPSRARGDRPPEQRSHRSDPRKCQSHDRRARGARAPCRLTLKADPKGRLFHACNYDAMRITAIPLIERRARRQQGSEHREASRPDDREASLRG